MPRPSPTLPATLTVALLTLAWTARAAPPAPTPEADKHVSRVILRWSSAGWKVVGPR